MTGWHVNSDKSAIVSDHYCWSPIEGCPKNIKVLLLTNGNTCVVGNYNGQDGYTHWAPLPRVERRVNYSLRDHMERMRNIDEMSD